MKTIYKYEIYPNTKHIDVPLLEGKTFEECVVSTRDPGKYGAMWIWVLVDTDQKEKTIQIVSHLTGEKILEPIQDLIPICTSVFGAGLRSDEYYVVVHYFQYLNPEGCEQ